MPRLVQIFLIVAVLVTIACPRAESVQNTPTRRASCGLWSAWEIRASSSGSSVRRRESCSDGRLEEQCRRGEGPVTACSLEDWRPAFAAMPQNNRPRTAKSSLVYGYSGLSYRTYSYGYTYNTYAYAYVTFYCSVSCIVGAVIGGLAALAFLIGGAVVLFCWCARANQRNGGVIRPVAATTTTTVVAPPAQTQVIPPPQQQQFGLTNQGFNGGGQGSNQAGYYGQQQQQTGAYPPAYPAAYPPKYPDAYPPAYPPSGGQGFGGASGAAGDAAYPPPYPAAQH